MAAPLKFTPKAGPVRVPSGLPLPFAEVNQTSTQSHTFILSELMQIKARRIEAAGEPPPTPTSSAQAQTHAAHRSSPRPHSRTYPPHNLKPKRCYLGLPPNKLDLTWISPIDGRYQPILLKNST